MKLPWYDRGLVPAIFLGESKTCHFDLCHLFFIFPLKKLFSTQLLG